MTDTETSLFVIETTNSYWYIDPVEKEYLRSAKGAQQFAPSTYLDYDVWLPYDSWKLIGGELHIMYPGAFIGIRSYLVSESA